MDLLEKTIGPGLGSLMGLACGKEINWQDADLSEILIHQLQTPLLCDLKADPGQLRKLREMTEGEGRENLNTFADLLFHPNPPLWLLRLAKDFAKELDQQAEQSLPPKVATALYYAFVACALVRMNIRITALDDDILIKGFDWLQQQAWVLERLRQLGSLGTVAVKGLS